jgi:hypothetical protein
MLCGRFRASGVDLTFATQRGFANDAEERDYVRYVLKPTRIKVERLKLVCDCRLSPDTALAQAAGD